MAIPLRDYQIEAVEKMCNGCILCGGVGSGKSRTSLAYYYIRQGGIIGVKKYVKMTDPKDLYIITTARKRDQKEWEGELPPFLMTTNETESIYKNKIVIDSWNNIKKYKDVKNSFFIFDEQRVVGSGAWVQAFLSIAKTNEWILLSATPGDTWQDYIPVFLANGFYKNKTEFNREHIVFSRFSKFPKVDRYLNTKRLERLRDRILVDMDFHRDTISHHEDVLVEYDILTYKKCLKDRRNPYEKNYILADEEDYGSLEVGKDISISDVLKVSPFLEDNLKNGMFVHEVFKPFKTASELCYTLRKIVNSDNSRIISLLEIVEKRQKVIVFYNYDYERDMLLNTYYGDGFEISEWNGYKHQPIPDTDKWVYIVQYNAGAEGWNCIRTNTIVFFSQNYSYKIMQQSAGRIDRLNTPYKDLYYYHFKTYSGIDLAISRALREKKKFNEQAFAKL